MIKKTSLMILPFLSSYSVAEIQCSQAIESYNLSKSGYSAQEIVEEISSKHGLSQKRFLQPFKDKEYSKRYENGIRHQGNAYCKFSLDNDEDKVQELVSFLKTIEPEFSNLYDKRMEEFEKRINLKSKVDEALKELDELIQKNKSTISLHNTYLRRSESIPKQITDLEELYEKRKEELENYTEALEDCDAYNYISEKSFHNINKLWLQGLTIYGCMNFEDVEIDTRFFSSSFKITLEGTDYKDGGDYTLEFSELDNGAFEIIGFDAPYSSNNPPLTRFNSFMIALNSGRMSEIDRLMKINLSSFERSIENLKSEYKKEETTLSKLNNEIESFCDLYEEGIVKYDNIRNDYSEKYPEEEQRREYSPRLYNTQMPCQN